MSAIMHRKVEIILFSLIFIIFGICNASLKKKEYDNVIVNTNQRINLKSLAFENLLKNFEDVSEKNCNRDLLAVQNALMRYELWALKMLDASSKIPVGILEGNILDMGMYDECVAIRISDNVTEGEIRGRHCMYNVNANLGNAKLSVTLSICVPSSCSAADVFNLVNGTLHSIVPLQNLGLTVRNAQCSSVEKEVWDVKFTVAFTILIAFVSFLIICTLCDAICSESKIMEQLKRFSLLKSAAAILSTKVKKDTIPVIHGLRVFSMAWVVLGHEYMQNFSGPTVNAAYVAEWLKSWNSLYIFTAPFAVDTFFTISGFLMTYLFLKQMPNTISFNVPMYYLHRYFRLTPSMVVLIIAAIVFVPKIGSGARWDSTIELSMGQCRTYWWPTVLYLQNFVERDHVCLGHLWYLAVDMQLFWISPLILYPLYKMPKIGLLIVTIFLIGSMITTALIVGINEYPIVSITNGIKFNAIGKAFQNVYQVPYTRATPWLIGILLGFEISKEKRRLPHSIIKLGWLLTAAAFSFCILGTRYFMKPNYVYDVVLETFFFTASKPVWAFGICWIIYTSIHNSAGIVYRILSLRFLVPLSKLSYWIYLVHYIVQIMHIAGLRTSSYFSDYFIWHTYLGDLIISIVVAFFSSLLFESPIFILEKMLLRR